MVSISWYNGILNLLVGIWGMLRGWIQMDFVYLAVSTLWLQSTSFKFGSDLF